MVAPEPFREARQPVELKGPSREADLPDTVNMTVKEVRELISALQSPDVRLLVKLTRDPRSTVRHMAYRQFGRRRTPAANEDLFRDRGETLIAGADEAGRGSLAGPLAAAAVAFEPGVVIRGVRDSKQLTPEKREDLYGEIIAGALAVSVVFVDATMIDRWGLQVMNMKALADSLGGLGVTFDVALVDHFNLPGLGVPTFGIPHADEIFQSVAAASIVAKVERDRVMRAMHRKFPLYCFDTNKGYGTAEHWRAIDAHGPCEIHRMSFRSVAFENRDVPLWEDHDE